MFGQENLWLSGQAAITNRQTWVRRRIGSDIGRSQLRGTTFTMKNP
jgi:hypothetical protein